MEQVTATDASTVPAEVAYVTACALGLAFSEHRDDAAVEELVRAAAGRPQTLRAARAALMGYPTEDATVVRWASELLAAAETSATART